MINDNDKVNMFKMRMKGYTLEEIGKEYGVTRERVRQILKDATSGRTNNVRGRKGIVYPNISKWLRDNNLSIKEFSVLLGYAHTNNSDKLRRLLKGKQQFKMNEILKILEITKMTFEEAFELDKTKEVSNNAR